MAKEEGGGVKEESLPGEDNEGRLAWREYLRRALSYLRIYWRIVFATGWSTILLSFLLIHNELEVRCACVVLLMAGFWVTECLPIPITSLMPVVLLPVLGILSTQETCGCYMNDTIMVFIGGLILAIGTEHCNLHMRIALLVMKTLGCSHSRLLAGLCTVTSFISMWIANAAATAMMVPIVFAVLNELERQGIGRVFISTRESTDPENPEIEPEITPTSVTKAYLLAAAYASSFGGTGSLVGTPTNLAFKGIFESTFPDAGPITFGGWICGSFPQLCVNVALLWLYLRIAYLGFLRPSSKEAAMAAIGEEGEKVANEVIKTKLRDLGPMTFHETAIAVLFIGCIFLWVFRAPGFIAGWAVHITDLQLADSMPAIFVCIMMFLIPKDPAFLHFCSKDPSKRYPPSSEGLMTWTVIQRKMPWSLIFLLGGGFAVSKATRVSGLARRIGQSMVPLRTLPPVVMLGIILLAVNTLTEFTSNVGTANIFLPIVAHMCVAMRIHPLYLMIPVTIMCSYAFRMPVATPPNAIITITGHIPGKNLLVAGCVPAFYSWLVNIILFPTWGALIFDMRRFPEWAEDVQAL